MKVVLKFWSPSPTSTSGLNQEPTRNKFYWFGFWSIISFKYCIILFHQAILGFSLVCLDHNHFKWGYISNNQFEIYCRNIYDFYYLCIYRILKGFWETGYERPSEKMSYFMKKKRLSLFLCLNPIFISLSATAGSFFYSCQK